MIMARARQVSELDFLSEMPAEGYDERPEEILGGDLLPFQVLLARLSNSELEPVVLDV